MRISDWSSDVCSSDLIIDDHQPRAIEDVLMEFGESAQDRADRIDVRARREIPSGEEWFAGAGDQRHDAGVAGRIRDGRRLLDGEGEGFGRPRHEILSTAFGRAEYLEPPHRPHRGDGGALPPRLLAAPAPPHTR